MILADKIMDLRKRNGWSQEELANQLGVSRQAVSKWESAASVPDLNKIIKMSEVFDVSTDYLLKDAIERIELNDEIGDMPESKIYSYAEEPIRSISMEEANCYLEMVQMTAGKIAFWCSALYFISGASYFAWRLVGCRRRLYDFRSDCGGSWNDCFVVACSISGSDFCFLRKTVGSI